ncbi:hypothetical protein JMJ35_006143 [Cladonia borealis]|uniref:Thioesterase domain-containing protein n=1 Tax=Cladonia borealis TaxID=184061 RepID=A0AA39QYM6_9LECA|nr:hypothetical protein JMJ35_006143 [Cladonia borealis]
MSPSKPDPRGVIQNFIDYMLNEDYAGHDTAVLRRLKVPSAYYKPTPCATFRINITPDLCNKSGNLHGGATAMIFDLCTTFPIFLARQEGSWKTPSVSRTLNVAYLAAVRAGEEVEVEAEVIGIGKRLVHCRGTMKRVSDGTVVATCEHGKVNTDSQRSKL